MESTGDLKDRGLCTSLPAVRLSTEPLKEEPHDNLQQVTKAILASIRKFMDRDIIRKRR